MATTAIGKIKARTTTISVKASVAATRTATTAAISTEVTTMESTASWEQC
jgi:hypothetical protein